MNELALFAGIHGIGLGLRRAFERWGLPFRTVCYIEKDDYCCKVLEQRMRAGDLDDAPIWGDITTFNGKPWAGCVDLISGGFPCQDISTAGKGAGIEGERSGLFFELMRVVREVEPPLVLLENVPALLIRGFGRVAAEMAESGYDVQWDCIPAAAVGADHQRDRVFILAYACGERRSEVAGGAPCDEGSHEGWPEENDNEPECDGESCRAPAMADTKCCGRDGRSGLQREGGRASHWSVEPGVGGALDGVSGGMDGVAAWERGVPRVAQGVPDRVARLRALGNAVVPQVAEYIGERLIEWLGSECLGRGRWQ